MKTTAIIYGLISLICFIKLATDEKTTSFKKFGAYWYFSFIPIYNVVMLYFILKEIWAWDRIVLICCLLLIVLGVMAYNLAGL